MGSPPFHENSSVTRFRFDVADAAAGMHSLCLRLEPWTSTPWGPHVTATTQLLKLLMQALVSLESNMLILFVSHIITDDTVTHS